MKSHSYCIDSVNPVWAVLRRLAAGIALLLVAGAALAADVAPDLGAARRLLDAGKPEQAAALLERDLPHYAGNADYDSLLGQALLQAGKTGEALFAFERVVMVDPGNIEARLKAAQINLDRGNAAYAEDLMAPLATLRPNVEQQNEIARMRAQIGTVAAGEKFSLRGYVIAGIGWDDNVTSGPDRSALVIPALNPQGLTTTALGSAARDHDNYLISEAGLSLRTALDENTWLTGVGSLRQGDNQRRKDAKEGVASLDLGLLRRSGDDFFGATLLTQRYFLGSILYRNSVGGRANWIHTVDARSRLTGYVQRTEFDYPDQAIDNAGRSIVGAMRDTITADGASIWQYGAYAGKEKASDAGHTHFGYRLSGLHVGNTVTLRDDLTVSAGAVAELHRHLALDALYPDIMRRDILLALGLAADYRLGGNWHLVPRYTYTHNTSNIELYQYARNTFALQLRWDFDHGKN